MIWVGIIPTDTEKALSLICSNIAVFDVSANLLYAFDIRMPIARCRPCYRTERHATTNVNWA